MIVSTLRQQSPYYCHCINWLISSSGWLFSVLNFRYGLHEQIWLSPLRMPVTISFLRSWLSALNPGPVVIFTVVESFHWVMFVTSCWSGSKSSITLSNSCSSLGVNSKSGDAGAVGNGSSAGAEGRDSYCERVVEELA